MRDGACVLRDVEHDVAQLVTEAKARIRSAARCAVEDVRGSEVLGDMRPTVATRCKSVMKISAETTRGSR